MRQKLFRAAFGASAVAPASEDADPELTLQTPSLALDPTDPGTCVEDGAKPRHRGFGLPSESRLNTETGRQIGFDYARAGIPPPDYAPLAFQEGFASGRKKRPSRISQHTDTFERKVLRLRYSAWRRNRVFDSMVTAAYLKGLYRRYCPITRIVMTSGTGLETDATVERVYNGAAYAVGNLAFMSAKANWAKANRTLDELVEIACNQVDLEGLPSVGWERLAALSNMFQPDPESAFLMPMFVLPPTGLLVNNPTVIVQECISSVAAGWEAQQIQQMLRAAVPGKAGKRALDTTVEFLRGAIIRELRTADKSTLSWTLENAWRAPGVFECFRSWYAMLTPKQIASLIDANARARPHALSRVNGEVLDAWALATRGYDHADEVPDLAPAV